MKSYLQRVVIMTLVVTGIVSLRGKSTFEKEQGKYRVESNEALQENTQISDMLSKVLAAKDDKDFQLPDSEESLQQLQSVLSNYL